MEAYGKQYVETYSDVIKSYADPQYLTDDKLDWRKIHPLIWATGGDFNYYQLGERIISKEVDND